MPEQELEQKWESIDIEKLKAGDPVQRSELYGLLLPRLRLLARSYFRSRGVPRQNIDDFVQDAIFKIFSSIHKYEPVSVVGLRGLTREPEYKGFRSWCYRVAINLLQTETVFHGEDMARVSNEDLTTTSIFSVDITQAYEAALQLDEILQTLSPSEKDLVELLYLGYTTKEMAQKLDTSVVALSQRMYRLKKKISHFNAFQKGGRLNVETEHEKATS